QARLDGAAELQLLGLAGAGLRGRASRLTAADAGIAVVDHPPQLLDLGRVHVGGARQALKPLAHVPLPSIRCASSGRARPPDAPGCAGGFAAEREVIAERAVGRPPWRAPAARYAGQRVQVTRSTVVPTSPQGGGDDVPSPP